MVIVIVMAMAMFMVIVVVVVVDDNCSWQNTQEGVDGTHASLHVERTYGEGGARDAIVATHIS